MGTSSVVTLEARLSRYLSPALFPVHLRHLPRVVCHEVPRRLFDVGPFRISASLVCHPGLTVGYRIEAEEGVAPICPTTNPPSPLRMVDGLLRIGFLVPT
jgi:hypothetical protein